MKKILILALIIITNALCAQDQLYKEITAKLKKEYPNLNPDNKLIIVNTWSSSNLQKREFNVKMNSVLDTFGSAKLKGGLKGIIGVVINTADDANIAVITLGKDQVNIALPLSKDGLNLDSLSNVVFDSNGNLVYSGLQPETVYNSIHQLITR